MRRWELRNWSGRTGEFVYLSIGVVRLSKDHEIIEGGYYI